MYDLSSIQAVFPKTALRSPYGGPERRAPAAAAGMPGARWFSAMLDEIDYGMVLVTEEAEILHANHVARKELDADHPLQRLGRQLCARLGSDLVRLHDALALATRRGLRHLVSLGEGEGRAHVAVLPLGGSAALVVLGKRSLSERLSVQSFARLHGLTPTESRVLEALCEGLEPRDIAELNAVGLATVRTQIGSIRAKTGADNIRALVRLVAVLPPMVGSLRA